MLYSEEVLRTLHQDERWKTVVSRQGGIVGWGLGVFRLVWNLSLRRIDEFDDPDPHDVDNDVTPVKLWPREKITTITLE